MYGNVSDGMMAGGVLDMLTGVDTRRRRRSGVSLCSVISHDTHRSNSLTDEADDVWRLLTISPQEVVN